MAIRKPALELPSQFAEEILSVARQLDQLMQYDFAASIELANEELALLRQAEDASGRRLHKGHPLHNLGVAWFRRRPDVARRHFFGAHAEDVRLWPRLRPSSWEFLAERMLRSLFRETTETIRRLERLARRNPGQDPLEVAEEAIADRPPPRFPERIESVLTEEDLLQIPGGRRVFVGGSYPSSMDRIDIIETACRNRGYEPVVVAQYQGLPGERSRPKSFRLLGMCSAAVFEGTSRVEPGWWPEIERIVQVKPMPTLVAYLALHADDEIHTSSMFPRKEDHRDLDIHPWGNTDHLRDTVGWWLDRLASATAPVLTVEAQSEGPAVVAVPSGSPFLGGSVTPYGPRDDRASNATVNFSVPEGDAEVESE